MGEGAFLFEREHHLRIAAVLKVLDGALLSSLHCYFGGGTAIALLCDEYRESVDIDFLVSDPSGYRELRQRLKEEGFGTITLEEVRQTRDLRLDQYGLRTFLEVGGVEIKFEIIREARIDLDDEGAELCGIRTLSRLDMVASKMLANSDRWGDTSACSRDLIDLAMLAPDSALVLAAIEKTGAAYGEDSIRSDLHRAFEALRQKPHRLEACMESMKMTLPTALLWKNIRELISRVPTSADPESA